MSSEIPGFEETLKLLESINLEKEEFKKSLSSLLNHLFESEGENNPTKIIEMYEYLVTYITDTYSEWGYLVMELRTVVIQMIGWGIPDKDAFTKILDFLDGKKVISVGCGGGIVEYILETCGTDVTCVDNGSWKNIPVGCPLGHVKTVDDGVKFLEEHTEFEALYLSWPGYESSFGHDALKAFTGQFMVYIGEDCGGCCADDTFFDLLSTEWEKVGDVSSCVCAWGIHDTVSFYKRK